MHFADRWLNAAKEKGGPICVGIDPVLGKLPAELRDGVDVADSAAVAEAFRTFVLGVLDSVAQHVPCVKLQSACFERYGWRGVQAYEELVAEAARRGLLVIGDAKRGDIGISAEHYAVGCLADRQEQGKTLRGPDALTINPYFGEDGVMPFVNVAREQNKGLFALVRTSNPGGDAIQRQELASGGIVAQSVARVVAELGSQTDCIGKSGYSVLGAVVGATKAADARHLRELMPQQLFLVPGFGAQGAGADDVRACFKEDGTGAIITASRSVIFAYEHNKSLPWQQAVEQAALQMKTEVAQVIAG